MRKARQEGYAQYETTREGDTVVARLYGDWTLGTHLPAREPLENALGGAKRLAFDASAIDAGVGQWGSPLLVFLSRCGDLCEQRGVALDMSGVPANALSLFELAEGSPVKEDVRMQPHPANIFERVGYLGMALWKDFLNGMEFVGLATQSFFRLLTGRARMPLRDFFVVMQSSSSGALPIVTLISFLVGLIIAFLGAVVLVKFNAGIYVSYLVGFGIFRQMGALMLGIIMAGRTGAAFAAQIGSMRASQEIDALTTLGISPIDYVVLPRLLALVLVFPVLTIYADVIGVFGGFIVSVTMFDQSPESFMIRMNKVISLNDILLGVVKGTIYGWIVAFAGCWRGLQSGQSADAVGQSTTRAVVTGITLIIIANAIIDWIAAIYDF